MTEEMTTIGALTPESILPQAQEETASVLILGGLETSFASFSAGESLLGELSKQDLCISALHQSSAAAVEWLTQAGVSLVALAGMRGGVKEMMPSFSGAQVIGAGLTESLANRPFVRSVNGIRLGFLSFGEQTTGKCSGRADASGLMAFDQVRMLLNQCDHVIVLVRAGLDSAQLPLPEWRARYRRWIDAGASLVVDTGCAKGWEAYKNGLIFYGLGAPNVADSLAIFLKLHRNGRLKYEARALQTIGGTLDFSANDAFKAKIDAQNVLFTDDAAYLSAVNEMCKSLYCEMESTQKRGVLGLFSSHSDEEARLLSLLENESLRLAILRAIRLKHAHEEEKQGNAKRA